MELACACGARHRVKPELAGKKVRCRSCGAVVAVPGSAPSRGPAPADPPKPPPAKAPAVESGPPNQKKWMRATAGGAGFLVISLVVLIIVLASGGDEPPAPEPAPGQAEATDIRGKIKEREREAAPFREVVAGIKGDTRLANYADEIAALEKERDRLVEETTRLQAVEKDARGRLARLKAATPISRPPKPPPPKAGNEGVVGVVQKAAPSVLVIRTNRGGGTGFLIGEGGWVVTNYHVIAASRTINLTVIKNKATNSHTARTYAIDRANDLALLKTDKPPRAPSLEFGDSEKARVGDPVVVIGNPGMGNRLLEHTVTSGILSSAEREIEGRHLLQITAAINPGNSGGPLLDKDGKIIGIVTLKAVSREGIAFAVPSRFAQALFEKRDGEFRVPGTLAEWEAAGPKKMAETGVKGIPLGTLVAKFGLDEEHDRVVALDASNNQLLIASLSEKKVVSKVFLGSDPVDFVRVPGKEEVWVPNRGSNNLVRVDLKAAKIVQTLDLPGPPKSLLLIKGNLWFTLGDSQLGVYVKRERKVYTSTGGAAAFAYDGKKDRLISANAGGIGESDPDDLIAHYKKVLRYKDNPVRSLLLREEGRKIGTWHRYDSFRMPPRGARIVADAGNRVFYFNRGKYRMDKLDAPQGVFKPNPYSKSRSPALRALIARIPQLDQILAASPNGKWVVNGTHVFDANRYTVRTELPIPTPIAAFSADSKTLYLLDVINKAILPFGIAE